jgi:hypothetical protein
MKVNIGPYVNYFGPFQLADKLQAFGVSEEKCFHIGVKLANIPYINEFSQWVHDKRKRKVKVKIHDYDTWNMDHTLALIIVPMLKQLVKDKHGSQKVDNEDVPEHLRSVASADGAEVDDFYHLRWYWVLHEMIWAFENIIEEDLDVYWNDETKEVDIEAWKKHSDRIANGTRLFGKYYMGLWD